MKPTARDCSDDRLVLARRGALSWSAWNDLATHLATCPDCRIDWQLSADFDGSAGAVPGDERMIARAADAATARMPLGLVRVAVAAGALLAVAGVASGAIVLHARYVGGSAAAGVGVRRGAGGNGSGAAHASDAASRSVVRADEPPPSGPPRSQPGSIPEIRRSPRRLAVASSPSVDPTPVVAATEPPQLTEPERLFGQAVAARSQGRLGDAIAGFRELQRRFDDTPEAVTSLVSLGQVLLSAGAPSEALASFEAYLAHDPAGALAPEALAGRAYAFVALGRAGPPSGASP